MEDLLAWQKLAFVLKSRFYIADFLLVQTTRNPNRTMIGIPFWVALLSVAMVTIVDEYDGPDSLAYGGA